MLASGAYTKRHLLVDEEVIKQRRVKKGGKGKETIEGSMSSSIGCAVFSWVAILVLLSFALLLDNSPEYVKHISNVDRAREATYQAAGLYSLAFAIACIAWLYDKSYKDGKAAVESRRASVARAAET